jgi:hypothetical protein
VTPEQVAILPRPLAFVLPGGGALGSYQVGVLRALTEAGIEPDLLIGVSAGAVNAALFAWNSGLDGIMRAGPKALQRARGLGPAKAAQLAAAIELGKRAQGLAPVEPGLGEQVADLAELEPELFVQEHGLEPLQVLGCVLPVAGLGASGRAQQSDAVVVVQRPHRDAGQRRQFTHRVQALRVHDPDARP